MAPLADLAGDITVGVASSAVAGDVTVGVAFPADFAERRPWPTFECDATAGVASMEDCVFASLKYDSCPCDD